MSRSRAKMRIVCSTSKERRRPEKRKLRSVCHWIRDLGHNCTISCMVKPAITCKRKIINDILIWLITTLMAAALLCLFKFQVFKFLILQFIGSRLFKCFVIFNIRPVTSAAPIPVPHTLLAAIISDLQYFNYLFYTPKKARKRWSSTLPLQVWKSSVPCYALSVVEFDQCVPHALLFTLGSVHTPPLFSLEWTVGMDFSFTNSSGSLTDRDGYSLNVRKGSVKVSAFLVVGLSQLSLQVWFHLMRLVLLIS